MAKPGVYTHRLRFRSPRTGRWSSAPRRGSRKNLVYLVPRVLTPRRLQIAQGAFHVGVTQPKLNGSEIHARPQTARSERTAELVKPEAICVQLRTFRYGLQTIEEV